MTQANQEEIRAKIMALEAERDAVAADYQDRVNILVKAGNQVVQAMNDHLETLKAQAAAAAETDRLSQEAEALIHPSEIITLPAVPSIPRKNGVKSTMTESAHDSST